MLLSCVHSVIRHGRVGTPRPRLSRSCSLRATPRDDAPTLTLSHLIVRTVDISNNAQEKRGSVPVVDDDAAIRTLVTRVLVRAGFAVTEAVDGQVAIEKLATEHFDAVVLGLMMPHATGFDVIAYIRERLTSRQCVIVVSAAAERLVNTVHDTVVRAKLRKPV
jgi:CheY-like chemotaxis protein